jgi:HD-GYP domain-containing protein (c-di-GMP phosphodiesterase class II)
VCTVYQPPGTKLDLSSLPNVRLRAADDVFTDVRNGPDSAVLIVDASMVDRARQIHTLPAHIIVVAADAAAEQALDERADLSLSGVVDAGARRRVLNAACEFSTARVEAARRRQELTCTRRDLHELNHIGISLMHERDQKVLLRSIVDQGKTLTESDGVCLFLVKRDQRGVPRLHPALFGSDSLPELPVFPEIDPLPVDSASIVGHAAVTKHHIVISDARELPPDSPFVNNVDFERKFGYYVQSMLVVPMLDHRDGIVGVLAFVNRKRHRDAPVRDKESAMRTVVPYSHREVRLARALASIAAASIENTRLYDQIESILESFVKAAVSAIDQRDPSTAGHSLRVATLTTELAKAAERGAGGRYRDLRFSQSQMRELHFAALLHDLGKVGVREDVLTKAKKLPPQLWERVEARFNLIRRTLEADHYRVCGCAGAKENVWRQGGPLDARCAQLRAELDHCWEIVRAANEPKPLSCSPSDLDDIARHVFDGPDNRPMHYLEPGELQYLQIAQGTLDEQERREIQSHVKQTYQFLLQIPWTDDLKNLARYAYGHHEKLDGSGYPRRIKGDEIPVQTRIMTIADIFDALTASDRPYKQAVSPDTALDIIRTEADAGMLDADLVRVLLESQVYRRILRP